MKKSTLALSIAAALGGMGLAGTASAMTTLDTTGTATSLSLNARGIGHQLVFPYFTAQGDNATLLSIVNTDTANGKLVKVRFRGASNSDDLYDFQVLMSPGDVWTAAVSRNATTNVAKLTTSDNSCTLPATIAADFSTSRVDPRPTNGDSKNETREGYVEVINMADIKNVSGAGSALFTTIKHSATGTVTCSATVLEAALGTDTNKAGYVSKGLDNPSGGLAGDWIILNQAKTAAWSGAATALLANGTGNMVIWPQKFGNAENRATATLDPILTNNIITAQQYDLPDMSTPYIGTENATTRTELTTAALAVKGFANQYVTADDIAAVTDILFSQPTRRYHAAVNYNATATTSNTITVTGTLAAAVYSAASNYYENTNTTISKRQLCVTNVNMPGANQAADLYDRSEITPNTTVTTPTPPFVISPNVPVDPAAPTPFYFCGEAAVLSVNAGSATDPSALNASVARSDVTYATTYTDGWMFFTMDNSGYGYPLIGASFIRAANGAVNYGFTYPNKIAR